MQYDENAEKYGYEGEMTPLKCDKLQSYKGDVTIPVYGTIADAQVYLKKDVDEAIAELKDENATLQGANDEKAERIVELQKQVDELVIVKKSAELIFMNLLDCGLIKEWYFNGKFNAVLKDDTPLLKIEALKQKHEDVQSSMYADVVDANMEIRRLRRALWLARALRAEARKNYWYARSIHEGDERLWSIDGSEVKYIGCIKRNNFDWLKIWCEVQIKCRAMADKWR